MESFDDSIYQAQKIEKTHEELMKINPEITKIRMAVTEKREKSFLARFLMAFTNFY